MELQSLSHTVRTNHLGEIMNTDITDTGTIFSAVAKYYTIVILSTLFGTLLFAYVASTTYAELPFFAFVCGALSLAIGVFGGVMVGTKMVSEYDNSY